MIVDGSAFLEIRWDIDVASSTDAAVLVVDSDVAVLSAVDPFAELFLVVLLDLDAVAVENVALVFLEFELLAAGRMIVTLVVDPFADPELVLLGVNTAEGQ